MFPGHFLFVESGSSSPLGSFTYTCLMVWWSALSTLVQGRAHQSWELCGRPWNHWSRTLCLNSCFALRSCRDVIATLGKQEAKVSTSHTPNEGWRLNSWSLWPSRRGSYWTLDVRWSRLRLKSRLSLWCRKIIKIHHKSPKWGNPSCWAQLWKQGSYVSRFQSWKSGPEEILLTTASGTAI